MNWLFLTQNKTLAVFFEVMQALRAKEPQGTTGFYLSDAEFFHNFAQATPALTGGDYVLLKEWEILARAAQTVPDLPRLRAYEEKLGDPVLWNALVADRRIYLGRTATLVQDYPSRFRQDRMLAILQVAVEEMERLFDRVRPDAVVGFICVTIGDYLAYLVAKSRRIPFFNLRPTRIRNFFHAGESVLEPSRRLEEVFRELLREGVPPDLRNEASAYLGQVRQSHAMYEGVIPAQPAGGAPVVKASSNSVLGRALRPVRNAAARWAVHRTPEFRHDTSYPGVVYPLWVKAMMPLKKRALARTLGSRYVTAAQLAGLEYVFFPLHKEPEVTLLVYSRPYMNQIEVIRNLARSLPVGMALVVKEHPAGLGYHPPGYYRKLLAIPGVVLVPPETKSRDLIEKARLIAIISGSIGLEALMMKKPVLHFGRIPFSILPETMIRRAADPDRLAWDVKEMLTHHRHDEQALLAYVAATMQTSVPIDFYSILLERSGVYRPSAGADETDPRARNIHRLADYLWRLCGAARGEETGPLLQATPGNLA